MQSDEHTRRVAEGLEKHPNEAAVLSLAAEVIQQGNGAALFGALLHQVELAIRDEDARLPHLMRSLEAMMQVDQAVATYLMGRLYPIAGQKRLHEIYNGIELWLQTNTSPDVANALLILAAEVRPALKSKFLAWAEKIEANSSK